MAVEFGSIPFEKSPIDEYFEKRFSPYRDFSPSSSIASSPVTGDEEKAMMMKLEAIAAERQSEESVEEGLPSKEISDLAKTTATPLEYTISTARKLTYLGIYFLLNIALTISNKQLLVQVGITLASFKSAADIRAASNSLAIDGVTCDSHFNRLSHVPGVGKPQAHTAQQERALHSGGFLLAVHNQHCSLECLAVSTALISPL
jgi:hypothetical protein